MRIRKKGGGRKSYQEQHKEIDRKFLLVLKNHTAGSPMDEKVRWTNLSTSEIIIAMQEDHDIWISKHVVRKLLKKHNYRSRKAQKRRSMKEVANRDAQFKKISRLIDEYKEAGNPILSIDTKKKEFLGVVCGKVCKWLKWGTGHQSGWQAG